jgi:hypothetical protein
MPTAVIPGTYLSNAVSDTFDHSGHIADWLRQQGKIVARHETTPDGTFAETTDGLRVWRNGWCHEMHTAA